MTPPSKSPWPAPAATGPALDNSPLAVLERDQAIADGIRRGLIVPNFAQSCRAAVAAAIRAGLVTMPTAAPEASQAILEATAAKPATPGGGSKV